MTILSPYYSLEASLTWVILTKLWVSVFKTPPCLQDPPCLHSASFLTYNSSSQNSENDLRNDPNMAWTPFWTQISSLGDRREISSINPAMPPAFISCTEEERLKPAQFSLIYWWHTVSYLINRYRLERRMPKPYPGDSRFRRKSHFVN